MGGWVSLALGNLAQRAYSPPGGGGGGGWVGGQLGRGWVGLDSPKTIRVARMDQTSEHCAAYEHCATVTAGGPVVNTLRCKYAGGGTNPGSCNFEL